MDPLSYYLVSYFSLSIRSHLIFPEPSSLKHAIWLTALCESILREVLTERTSLLSTKY